MRASVLGQRAARSGCALALVLSALSAAGCTRSRPDTAGDSAAQSAGEGGIVSIAQPLEGATVSSPVHVDGLVHLAPGRAMAALVRSRDADGQLRWRGNGPLSTAADGRFTGDIAYALDLPGPGVLEALV